MGLSPGCFGILVVHHGAGKSKNYMQSQSRVSSESICVLNSALHLYAKSRVYDSLAPRCSPDQRLTFLVMMRQCWRRE
jgi:hypothetical protein